MARGRFLSVSDEASIDEECSLLSSPASTCCRSRDLSPASTCSTGTAPPTPSRFSSGISWAEASALEIVDASAEAKTDPVAEVATVVAQECSFLRLASQEFYDETSRVRLQRGVVKCIVFHCRGLPWAKRSKWLQPLLWSVAAVLKMQGCSCKMQSGELYVQLPGAAEAASLTSNLVRLDFAAARE
jgi:hypothetical protein